LRIIRPRRNSGPDSIVWDRRHVAKPTSTSLQESHSQCFEKRNQRMRMGPIGWILSNYYYHQKLTIIRRFSFVYKKKFQRQIRRYRLSKTNTLPPSPSPTHPIATPPDFNKKHHSQSTSQLHTQHPKSPHTQHSFPPKSYILPIHKPMFQSIGG